MDGRSRIITWYIPLARLYFRCKFCFVIIAARGWEPCRPSELLLSRKLNFSDKGICLLQQQLFHDIHRTEAKLLLNQGALLYASETSSRPKLVTTTPFPTSLSYPLTPNSRTRRNISADFEERTPGTWLLLLVKDSCFFDFLSRIETEPLDLSQ